MKISYKGNMNIIELLDKVKEYFKENDTFINCTNANIYLKLEDEEGNKKDESVLIEIAKEGDKLIDKEENGIEEAKKYVLQKIFNDSKSIPIMKTKIEKELKTIEKYLESAQELNRKKANIDKRIARQKELKEDLKILEIQDDILNKAFERLENGEFIWLVGKYIDSRKKYKFDIKINILFEKLVDDKDILYYGNDIKSIHKKNYVRYIDGTNFFIKDDYEDEYDEETINILNKFSC